MNVADHFHMPEGIYLLSHSAGCQPKHTQQYIQQKMLEPWQQTGECWPSWLGVIEDFKEALSVTINSTTQNICPVNNVSEGFYKFLTALPYEKNKRTILMHEHAFPSMGFVAHALKANGFDLKFIDAKYPAHDPNIWRDHMSDDILAALITHVYSNTGVRTDIPQITAICNERNIYSIIDVAQSIGILPIDAHLWNSSAIIGSCLKWLCGGSVAGFMFINPDILTTLKPQMVGWFSHQNPFEFDIKHFKYAGSANRFWGGTPSVLPYVTALAGLDVIHEIGIEAIFEHNQALKMAFAHQTVLEYDEYTSQHVGGTICLTRSNTTTNSIEAALKSHNVQFDRRDNTLRLSFHIYNTENEARQVGDIIHQKLTH
jgi:selenocysteine lyase/cysteine desulfurase